MAQVPPVQLEEAADALRPIYEGITRKTGGVLNFLKTLAHSPDLFQGFLSLDGAMRRFDLDPKLRELAYVRASQVNGCGYCRHYHEGSGRKAGLTERQLQELDSAPSSDAYDELQRLVIAFAEQLSRTAQVDEAVIDRLKEKLTDRQLVELTATVALANFTNRVNNALRIELP